MSRVRIPPVTRRSRNQPLIKPSPEVEGPPPDPRQSRANGCHNRRARAPLDFVPAGRRGQAAPNTSPRESIQTRFPQSLSAHRAWSRLPLPKSVSFYFARSPPKCSRHASMICSKWAKIICRTSRHKRGVQLYSNSSTISKRSGCSQYLHSASPFTACTCIGSLPSFE